MQQKPVRPRKERTENAARRRRQIVDAAIESVSRYGLSGTTLATVAALADMSQGSTVFYFQTKDQLLAEAFKAHCAEYREAWLKVFAANASDPVEHLMAFMLVDFSREQCNRRDISLWFDFWGETQARPQFREIYAAFAAERLDCLSELVARTQDRLPDGCWTVASFVKALEALSDGLWLELHMSKGRVIRREARRVLARFIGSAFPSRGESLMTMAERT